MRTSLKRFNFSSPRVDTAKPPVAAPFLDFVLLAGFVFALSQNRLLYSQGMVVDLPQPASTSEIIDGASCLGVLAIHKSGMLFLDGERCSLESLETALDRLDKPISGKLTVLVKVDRKVSIDTFVRACELLRSRGIEAVLVAVNERPSR